MPHTQETTARDLAGKLITFMETGTPPNGLFTEDVFCDFTMPQWRLQAQGIEDLVALRTAVRKAVVAALDRIDKHDGSRARHLRDSVRTGGACRYDSDPDRPVRWILDG